MKLNYFPETDSLYIDLSEKPSVDSREISEVTRARLRPEARLLLEA